MNALSEHALKMKCPFHSCGSHLGDYTRYGQAIIKGGNMLSFIPLEKSALARSPALSKWIEGWTSTLGRGVEVLDPSGWFGSGHNHYGGEMNMDGFWIPRFKDGTFFGVLYLWSLEL